MDEEESVSKKLNYCELKISNATEAIAKEVVVKRTPIATKWSRR
jgi:hypothetical protein